MTPQLLDAVRCLHGLCRQRDGTITVSLMDWQRLQRCLTALDSPKALPALTDKQSRVVHLISQSMTSKAIAGILGVSIKTVEKHRQAAMDKLGIHDVAGLTRWVLTNQ